MSFPEYLHEHIENKKDLIKISEVVYGLNSNIVEQKRDAENKALTLLVISGVSGGGKDTIVKEMVMRNPRLKWVKTCTTRSIREEEINDDPYIRLTEEEFQEAIRGNDVIESVDYADYHYCSLGSLINKVFEAGNIPVLRIDPEGAETYTNKWRKEENIFDKVNLICVFVVPPSKEEVRNRLMKRSGDLAFVNKRMNQLEIDLPFITDTQYILINETGQLEYVVDELMRVIFS